MRKNKQQCGYSLLELILALPLMVLIFLPVGTAMTFLVRTYHEMQLYTKLQQDMFFVLDQIRVGVTVGQAQNGSNLPSNVTDGLMFSGLKTAEKVQIVPGGKIIYVYQKPETVGRDYYSKFYVERDILKADAFLGLNSYVNQELFPTTKNKIDKKYQFKIEELTFSNAIAGSSDLNMVNVDFEASVRFRERSKDESADDDLALNKRTVNFSMKVFLSNSK